MHSVNSLCSENKGDVCQFYMKLKQNKPGFGYLDVLSLYKAEGFDVTVLW